MTKINPFTNVLFLPIIIIFCTSQCLAALSDKQLCYDAICSEPISLAKTTLAYISNDREVMSFGVNADVKVFSKGAGRRTDLWGVEISGKRGFAPKSFLNEYKILQSKLSYEVPVYQFNDEVNKVQPDKLKPIEKVHKIYPLLKDKLPQDDTKLPSSLVNSVDESIIDESKVINIDNTSSYEVIDGTTVYSESEPSVQPSFVSEFAHVTALPNEQASVATDSKIDSVYKKPSSDKSTFINNKESQPDANDTNKLEEVKLMIDAPEQINTKVLLESSEAIINSNLDTINKDDTVALDENNKPEDKYKNLEREKVQSDSRIEKDNLDKENVENKKIEEEVESEGILASITKRFKLLSTLEETVDSENDIQNGNDITESKSESNLLLKEQALEDNKVKDTMTEEMVPTTQIELDSSVISKEIETSEEIMPENIGDEEISDEKLNIKEEATEILSKAATTPSDVPLSNNFVHEDADKPAKELPTTVPILVDDRSASAKADIDNHAKNIQTQKINKEQKITENIGIESVVTSPEEDSIISSNLQETASIESSETENIKWKLPGIEEIYLEDINEDYKKTIVPVDEIVAADKILETTSLSSVEEITENIAKESYYEDHTIANNIAITKQDEALNYSAADIQLTEKLIVHNNVNNKDNLVDDSFDNVPIESNELSNGIKSSIVDSKQSIDSSQTNMITERIMFFNESLQKQNLSKVQGNVPHEDVESQIVSSVKEGETLPEYGDHINSEDKVLYKNEDTQGNNLQKMKWNIPDEMKDKVCLVDHKCTTESVATTEFLEQKEESESEEDNLIDITKFDHNYWKTLIYLCVTAFTVLVFTLGYYYIENTRRDGQLIAKINKLEQELLVSTKECEVFNENLKSTKEKLRCIEDESFGSNEMVASLKADLNMSQNSKIELEEQVTMLEKDLENATEAGLELERMLREVLSSNNEVNPLAQSVEDLQARLDAQQAANESLTNALNLKAQEIETLSTDFASAKKKCEEFAVELLQLQNELTIERNLKDDVEQKLTDKVHNLKEQVDELSTEKVSLYKELKGKEIEVKELMEVIDQIKSNNLDLEKLYDVFHLKIDTVQLREERDELKTRLSDVEGAHQLLEEHMKLVKEEMDKLSDQCKIAEKEKKEAETKLEVLSKFFKEKEAERQKEEAIWLQKQGEVVSTVERIHTMQNEIQNYKQQVEILKREIVDQEREYKNQISALKTKAHEQWVAARQNERRLEESKAEAGQLRNRLTLVEKNLNDTDPEAKLHRLELNGETVTSPPLFIGAESSNSPVMFGNSSVVPPPLPPNYLHCFPYLPPLPPTGSALSPYDISQRPPPLGGRLSSPPPMPPPPLHPPPASGGRYENAGTPPPPMSPPHLLPPYNRHRSPPPPPFGSDHIPLPPPPGSILPPLLGTTHSWGEESLPPPRNSGFHPHQREQRARNHKGSLHSSGESLDKAHHGKV